MIVSGQVLKLHSAFNPGVKDDHIIPVNMAQWLKKSSVIHFLLIFTDICKELLYLCYTKHQYCIVLYCICHSSYLTFVWDTLKQSPHIQMFIWIIILALTYCVTKIQHVNNSTELHRFHFLISPHLVYNYTFHDKSM